MIGEFDSGFKLFVFDFCVTGFVIMVRFSSGLCFSASPPNWYVAYDQLVVTHVCLLFCMLLDFVLKISNSHHYCILSFSEGNLIRTP